MDAPHTVDSREQRDDIVFSTTLASELARGPAPPFVWITPDVEHDLHDLHTRTVSQGNLWMRAQLPAVRRSTCSRDKGIALVAIVAFDGSDAATTSGCCAGANGR